MDNNIDILEDWKRLEIESITFTFDAGGDSISSMDWNVVNTDGDIIQISEDLEQAIEDRAYSECAIYGDSNGEYIGAYGQITVTYNKEEECFDYDNNGSQFYQDFELVSVTIKLPLEAVQLIQAKIKHIHYPYEFDMTIEYIEDCYLTEKDLEIIKSIENLIANLINNYQVEGYNVTETHSINFSTNKKVLSGESNDETDLLIIENTLYGYINAQFEYSY